MPSRRMSSPFSRSNPFAVAALAALLAAAAAVRTPGTTPGREAASSSGARESDAGAASEAHGAGLAPTSVSAASGASAPADEPSPPVDGVAAVPVQRLTVLENGRAVPLAFVDVLPTVANGRTVLLLRGRAVAGERWPATVAALADAGFRVIAPAPIAASARPELLAGHMALLLDSLGAAATTVVGEGEGAAVAVRLAARSPRVRRLALVVHGRGAGLAEGVRRLTLPTLLIADGAGRAAASAFPGARLATPARGAAAPLLAFLDE
ncbi:MAG TPA: hypothetical protein VFS08_20740 [Gemmatimonadaceae bacterium]|nr:hypothetical protein [Gemmatimonadaceae bacterium]